jgi:uncharacterized protein YdhG (YjbR/CyaY superfamily)
VRDQLQGFELSAGTIRFTVEAPLSEKAVRDVVSLRMREIDSASS